jgi:hypothetical protein
MSVGSVVDHNLFVTFGATYPALQMGYGERMAQGVSFTNNVFYCPNMVGTGYLQAAVSFGSPTDWPTSAIGPVGNNYNLAWLPKSSSGRSVHWYDGQSMYSNFGAGSGWNAVRGSDANSKWGRPVFTDSSLANFDPRPLAGSAVLFGPDGYVGPFGVAGSGDVTPPGQVTDLAASSPALQSVTLTWTAPGNDGFTGTAAAYDVRWSTQLITAATFASATVASGPPTPGVAGTPQSLVVSALSPGTSYYFALMARDGAGNWSALSTVASATTLTDTTAPAGVKDLRTNP